MASPSRANVRVRLPAAERHRQLLAAARRAYLELGVDRASVHQVAEFAGVNVATIYQHFSSSSDLFHEAVLLPMAAAVDEHLSIADGRLERAQPKDRVAELHACLFELMLDIGPTVNAVIFAGNDAGRRYFRDEIHPHIDAWLTRAFEVVGYDGAASRPSTASTLLGTYLWLSMHASYRSDDVAADAWATRIAAFVDGGITPPAEPDQD